MPQYALQLSQSADGPPSQPLCLTSVLGTCDRAELCSCFLEQRWMIVKQVMYTYKWIQYIQMEISIKGIWRSDDLFVSVSLYKGNYSLLSSPYY